MGILSTVAASFGLAADAPAPADPDRPVGDYSPRVGPPSRDAAAPVSVDRALTLPGVFRSVQIIAGVGSQLAVQSWRRGTVVDPAPALITSPDPWRSLDSWLERVLVCMATDGNAFLRIVRDPAGVVVALEVLNPFLTFVQWDTRGGRKVKTYRYYGKTGAGETLTDAEVMHLWALEVPGRTRGLGPIAACRAALGAALDVREYADGWFQNPDVPTGVLSSDQALDPATVAQYRKIWHDPASADTDDTLTRRVGPGVRVLGRGLHYEPVLLKPEDAQWLEAQNFGVLDVARMFGLPSDYLLAHVSGKSLTYANLEMIDAQFLRLTLFPVYLRKIEAALTAALPNGQRARFDTSELLRPDAKTRAEIAKTYADIGVVSPQDIRDAERIPGTAPGRPTPPPAAVPTVPAREQEPAR